MIAMPRTESRKIAIPTIRAKTEMAQPAMRPPAPPPKSPSVVVAAEPVVDPIVLDGPTERMSAPPVHMSMGLAEVAAVPVVIEPTPPPPPRVLAVGTSPPTAVAPIEIAEGSAKFEKPAVEEKRAPGSDMILPANPLMDLTDASLEGFIDCKLFEATQPPTPTPTPTPTPAPMPMPVPQQIVALPEVSLQSMDWRVVMIMVLIALGTAFGISYGVASWSQQRAAAAHHAQ